MKIVFISRILYLSGVTTHIRDLGEELIKKGHSVTILTAGNQFPDNPASKALEKSLLDVGINIKIMPYPIGKGKIEYLWGLLKGIWATRQELKRARYDVIHVHTLALSFIPKVLGYKFVSTTHISKLRLGPLLCNANEEIAISEEIYDDIIRRGCSPEHTHLIYNGVSSSFVSSQNGEERDAFLAEMNISPYCITILFVGTLCYRKGLDILCDAIFRLSPADREKVHVIFIGNYDNEISRVWLINIIKKKQLEKNITILGYRDPHDYYLACDIFVLPSRQEGFPLVSIEAMLGNCCVVRSNTEGACSQIIDGKTGFLFENENVGQLVKVLERIITNKNLRSEVSNAGRQYAIANFTAETMAKKTLEVYQKLR